MFTLESMALLTLVDRRSYGPAMQSQEPMIDLDLVFHLINMVRGYTWAHPAMIVFMYTD